MKEKILDIIRETLDNQYYYYLLIAVILMVVLKSIFDYGLYKKDCIVLGQDIRVRGYIRNTMDNIILIIIVLTMGFGGYISLGYAEKEKEPSAMMYRDNTDVDSKIKIIQSEKILVVPMKNRVEKIDYQKEKVESLKRKIGILSRQLKHEKSMKNICLSQIKKMEREKISREEMRKSSRYIDMNITKVNKIRKMHLIVTDKK